MSYNITYIGDNYKRLMWGVIADARVNIPAVKNTIGVTIKAYVDGQTGLVVPGVLPYAVSTENGNLVGYIALRASPGPVSIVSQQIRPAFVQDSAAISLEITNFITSGSWMFDILN
jgi:hypothetical protein